MLDLLHYNRFLQQFVFFYYFCMFVSMRLAVFIFSFLIMGLAIMPCLDSNTCENEVSSLSNEHNHSQDKGDLCSPFCTCTCCGSIGFVANTSTFFSEELDNHINSTVLIAPYHSTFVSSYFYSFWQPPKI